jgi:hypothetical protein
MPIVGVAEGLQVDGRTLRVSQRGEPWTTEPGPPPSGLSHRPVPPPAGTCTVCTHQNSQPGPCAVVARSTASGYRCGHGRRRRCTARTDTEAAPIARQLGKVPDDRVASAHKPAERQFHAAATFALDRGAANPPGRWGRLSRLFPLRDPLSPGKRLHRPGDGCWRVETRGTRAAWV